MSVLEIGVGVAIAFGLVGILFPVLPGSLLVMGAIAVWSFDIATPTSYAVAAICAVLVVGGLVVKFAVPGKRLKDSGVPNSTLLVGALCAVVGFFVVPVVGIVIGFVVGVYVAEVNRLGRSQAWPSTVYALQAVGLSIAIEFAAAFLAACVWAGGVAIT